METDAKADFVDDLIGIFGIDEVLDGTYARFCKVLWWDLDYVGQSDLRSRQ